VLTEIDLNRLENYFIAKNKLHNRYFNGSGVVCGLEVVCDPCDPGSVTVKSGYALAPCGEDIIVCKPAKAPICDLIQRCKPRDQNCDPYGVQQPTECKDGIQSWVLSICYDEKPSRGVQPLMSQPCSCGSGCSCGCGGQTQAGGCGCGGGMTTSQPTNTARSLSNPASKYNPQCEPTLICEGFTFTATKYVDPATRKSSDYSRYGAWGLLAAKAEQFGPLLTRLIACYLRAVEIRESFQGVTKQETSDTSRFALAYNDYRDALRQFAAEHVTHRCELEKELGCLEAPNANTAQEAGVAVTAGAWRASFARLNEIWLELFRECFCSALLPPCPEIESSDCVPLAVVTIDTSNCRVLQICNWSAREFALTLPTLKYWTSFIDWSAVKDVIAKLCCDSSTDRWAVILRMLESIVRSNASSTQPGIAEALMAATETTRPDAAAAAATTVSSATLSALSGVIEQAAMPDGLARLLSIVKPAAKGSSDEVRNLTDIVETLQREIISHREIIRNLQNPE
jgi:hypothetical protein